MKIKRCVIRIVKDDDLWDPVTKPTSEVEDNASRRWAVRSSTEVVARLKHVATRWGMTIGKVVEILADAAYEDVIRMEIEVDDQ